MITGYKHGAVGAWSLGRKCEEKQQVFHTLWRYASFTLG